MEMDSTEMTASLRLAPNATSKLPMHQSAHVDLAPVQRGVGEHGDGVQRVCGVVKLDDAAAARPALRVLEAGRPVWVRLARLSDTSGCSFRRQRRASQQGRQRGRARAGRAHRQHVCVRHPARRLEVVLQLLLTKWRRQVTVAESLVTRPTCLVVMRPARPAKPAVIRAALLSSPTPAT